MGRLGAALAAVEHPRRRFRPESKENSSVAGYDRLELALGGANGCGVLGGAAGGSLVAWKGARRTNSGSAVSSSASGLRGK